MKKFYVVLFLLHVFLFPLSAQTALPSTICNDSLLLSESPYVADSTVTIPKNCKLTVEPGVEIRMAANTYIIVQGRADFLGTASQPIRIHAKDSISWGIIFFDSTLAQKSTLNYVIIENATKGIYGNTHADSAFQQSALSGHYSTIELNNCYFKNNLLCIYTIYCDDILIINCIFDSTNAGEKIHLERTDDALIDSCILFFTEGDGDAVDIDGSDDVIISNNQVYGGDADALDIGNSGSQGCVNAVIRGNYIFNMGDKGVSCGENSSVFVEHNVIVGCDIGIASKANSQAVSHHNTLYGNKMGVSSYNKGDGWGNGNLTVTNTIIAACDSSWFVDDSSSLAISYSISDIDLMPGSGNIMGNPSLIFPYDDSTANFSLNWGSPAIDSGDPSFAIDPDGTRSDMGAVFYSHAVLVPLHSGFNEEIRLFPNPAMHTINVSIPETILNQLQEKSLYVLTSDLLGRKINEKKITDQTFRIDVSLLNPGIYFIKIESGSLTVFTEKLIIQK